jgi:hypothetical protein
MNLTGKALNIWQRRGLFLAAGTAVLIALMAADVLGLFAPRPSPARLIQLMSRAAERLTHYSADMMLVNGPGGPGQFCTEWVTPGGDVTLRLTNSLLDTVEAQRWHGNRWETYRPDVKLERSVTCAHLAQLPHGRWLISGYPTMEDLVAAVREARNPRVVREESTESGPVWVIECEPLFSNPNGPGRPWPPGQQLLGERWKVMLSKEMHLPVRILPSDETRAGTEGINVLNLKLGATRPPEKWRELAADPAPKAKRLDLTCDAATPGTVGGLITRVRASDEAYRRTLYPKEAPLPPGAGVPH